MKKIVLFAVMMLLGAVQNVNAQNEVNDCGTLILPIDYDDIKAGNDGLFVVEKDKKKGVINSNGNTIVPIEYDDVDMGRIMENCGGLIVVKKQQKRSDNKTDNIYGLFNKDGVMVAPMGKYESIRIRDRFGFEGMAEVSILKEIKKETEESLGSDKVNVYERRITEDGVLLKNGTLLTSYNSMSIEGNGLIEVHKGDLEGVINDKGEIIVPIQFSTVSLRDSKSLIYVSTPYQSGGRKKGVYNNKGEVVVPIGKYESIDINDTYMVVGKGGKKGVLNQKGLEIVPIGMYEKCSIREIDEMNHYYIEIESNKQRGALNDNGKVFIPIGKYEDFNVINQDLAIVKSNGGNGIVDKNGTLIVPIGKYDKLIYRYGVLTYSQNGKWGVIDEKGNQATPAEYDNIEPARHSLGIALVTKDGKIGVINSEGKQIVALGDYNGGSIIGKIGFLKSNEGTMIFNLDGKILAPIGKYEKCKQQYGNLTGVEINNWPIPLNPSNSDEGLYIVKSNGRCGIVKLW